MNKSTNCASLFGKDGAAAPQAEKIRIFAFADEASEQIDGQISAMKRCDLDGLEIRNVDGVNVSSIPIEKAREVRRKLDDAGLITWSVGSPLGKIDIEQDDFRVHLEKLKHTLEIASVLGTDQIRMFSFYIPAGKDPASYEGEVIDRLGQMCSVAADSGIRLCHENEKGIFGDTAERCEKLLSALPGLCGIFDPANFVQCGVDTRHAWDLLGSRIRYMHIKDARADGTVVPAGEGAGGIAEITEKYIKNGGRAFTVEPHLTEFVGLSALERTGEKSGITGYRYRDADEAFDTACTAFRNLIHL